MSRPVLPMMDVMYRALIRTIILLTLSTGVAVAGRWWWNSGVDSRTIARLEEQKRQLQQKRDELEKIVKRLGETKRVADVIVISREGTGESAESTLLFVEYDRAGRPLPPRKLQVKGTTAHVDAMVIEFDRDLVVANDPLRGQSISLFTRIFGEGQSAVSAERIDVPGSIPAFYRGTDEATSAFEQELWAKFWQLESDPQLRERSGVRVAVGKSVWGPFETDTLYTITLTPDGNLSRTAEPIRGVYHSYIQMMKQSQQTDARPSS